MAFFKLGILLVTVSVMFGLIRAVYRCFIEPSLFSWFYDEMMLYLYIGIGVVFAFSAFLEDSGSFTLRADLKGYLIVTFAWCLGLIIIIGLPRMFSFFFTKK